MDKGPLVIEAIEAGAELVREYDKYQPVKAAFWLKENESSNRHLFIASEEIDDTNFDIGYGEVVRLTRQMRSPYLDAFRVKLIAAKDPLARAATNILEQYNISKGIRYGERMFGGTYVDDVYIYPPLVPSGSV